ncbi:NTP transferase domain-containing protein [Candidatus Woesearchaeota archaeon]|jgi:YrbI family 3-deoxy-D-manno-octulosonate 8-phosphate phosphatase|nr:NTP transferase domain-containing protein [Candidatus Woesearchaeota archaeon]MBT4114125.1 NTP transferase domain-containing protein [Candidatus Woesearchaeota archaeon]MBT4248432.1 NTP transferase domain-containing protein [Candidatus Woesearchaeota archaeon]
MVDSTHRLNFVLDIDGVLTTGKFLYDENGKAYKEFGPHDADGLKLVKDKVNITFVTADKRGFPISSKRITDMGYPIKLSTEKDRYNQFKNDFGFSNTIFMGDGLHDAPVLKDCMFGVAPANARKEAKQAADFVTESKSAEGAVLDACIEINRRFLQGDKLKYKVCILAAGKGSRMSDFCEVYNKAIIPVQGKPAICHIIEKFPEDVEIVIAVGYKKESIKHYLNYAYPKRKITYVEDFELKGPGYSLLKCKDHLQSPFIFFAADTLVREPIPLPDKNWFGLTEVKNTERFCSASVTGDKISRVDDKVKTDNKYAFIGLAGVYDWEFFWNRLTSNDQIIAGEIQVSNGFRALMGKDMFAEYFTWFDVGVPEAYAYALENFPFGESYRGED